MMGRSHMAVGTASAAVVSEAAGLPAAPAAALCAAGWLGSLLPDVDEAGSTIRRMFLVGALLWPFSRLLDRLEHRGPTHTLAATLVAATLAALAAAVLAPPLAAPAAAGMAVGYASHLVCDGCTYSGVPVLAPWSRRRLHALPSFLRFPTGSWRESVVVVLLLALLVLLFALAAGPPR